MKAVLFCAAAVGLLALGFVAGLQAGGRYHLQSVGYENSRIARIDRFTGTVVLYNTRQGTWFRIAEPSTWDPFRDGGAIEDKNPFDKFDEKKPTTQ